MKSPVRSHDPLLSMPSDADCRHREYVVVSYLLLPLVSEHPQLPLHALEVVGMVFCEHY